MPLHSCRSCLAAVLCAAFALLAMPPGGARVMASELADRAATWEREDAATLLRTAPRLADAAVAPVFASMAVRVPSYSDWVYDWLSSLTTAWELAATGTAAIAEDLWRGALPNSTALGRRLSGVVESRFDDLVVLPTRSTAAIDAAWSRSMARLLAMDRQLTRDRRDRIATQAARSGVDPEPILLRHGATLLNPAIADVASPDRLVRRALLDVDGAAGSAVDVVMTRSLRPLASATVSGAARLMLLSAAGGVAAAPAADAGGTVFAVVLFISAGIWGVDYAINQLDAASGQPAFEAAMRSALREARVRAVREAERHAVVEVCARLAVRADCPPG